MKNDMIYILLETDARKQDVLIAITSLSDAALMIWKGNKFFSSLFLHLCFICFSPHNLL